MVNNNQSLIRATFAGISNDNTNQQLLFRQSIHSILDKIKYKNYD